MTPELGTEVDIDLKIPDSTVSHILFLRRAVSIAASNSALLAAREAVKAELAKLERDRQDRERQFQRQMSQANVTDPKIFDLSDLDPATRQRLIELRGRDVMAYAQALGEARLTAAERHNKASD